MSDPFEYDPSQFSTATGGAPAAPAQASAKEAPAVDPFVYAPDQFAPHQAAPSAQAAQPRVFTPLDLQTFKEVGLHPDDGLTFSEWQAQNNQPGAKEGRGFVAALSQAWGNIRQFPQNVRDMKNTVPYIDTPGSQDVLGKFATVSKWVFGTSAPAGSTPEQMAKAMNPNSQEAQDAAKKDVEGFLKLGAFSELTAHAVLDNWRTLAQGLTNTVAQKFPSLMPEPSPEAQATMGHDGAMKTRNDLMNWQHELRGLKQGKDTQAFAEDLGYAGTVQRTVTTMGPDGKPVQRQVTVNPAIDAASAASLVFDPMNEATAGVFGTGTQALGLLSRTATAARLAAVPLKAAQGAAEFISKVPQGAALVTGMRAASGGLADMARGVMLSPTGEILTTAGRVVGSAGAAVGKGLDAVGVGIAKPAAKVGLGVAYVAGSQLLGSDDSLWTSIAKAGAGVYLAPKLMGGIAYASKAVLAGDLLKAAGGFAKIPTQEGAAAIARGTATDLPGLVNNGVTNATARDIANWTASTGMPAAAARLIGRNLAQGTDNLLHGIAMGGAFGYATSGDSIGFLEGAGNGFGLASTVGLGHHLINETAGRVTLGERNLSSITTAVKAMADNGVVPTAGLGLVLGDSPGGIRAKQALASEWLASKSPAEQALFTKSDAKGTSELSWQDHYQAAFIDLALRGARGADGQDFDVKWLSDADYKSHMLKLDTYADPKTGQPVKFSPAESSQRAEAAPWVTVTDGNGRPVVLLNMEAHGAAVGIDRAFHEVHHAMSALRGPGEEQQKKLADLEKTFTATYGPNWTRSTISDNDRLYHASLSGDPMGMALARFHNAMFGEGGQFGGDAAQGELYDQYKQALGLKPGQYPAWSDMTQAVKGTLHPLLGSAMGTVYAEGGAEAMAGLMRRSGTNPLDFLSRVADGRPIATQAGTVYYHGGMMGGVERGLRSLGIGIDGVNTGAALGNGGSMIFRDPAGAPQQMGGADKYLAQFVQERLSHLDRLRMTDSYDEAATPVIETKIEDLHANPERAREVASSGLIDEEHFRKTTEAAVAKAVADEAERAKAAGEAPKEIKPEDVPVPPEAIKQGRPEAAKEQQKKRDQTVRAALNSLPESPADPRALRINPENGRYRGYYMDPGQLDAVVKASDPAWNDQHRAIVQMVNEQLWNSYDPARAGPPPGPLQVVYHPAMQAGKKGAYKYASLNSKTYLVQPFGFNEATDGQWNVQMFDAAGHEAQMAAEFGKDSSTYKDVFGTVDNMRGKTQRVLANYRQDQPGATNGVTTRERDAVNAFMGFPSTTTGTINTSSIPLAKNRFIQSMRLDRIANVLPTDGMAAPVDYKYSAQNFSPAVDFLNNAVDHAQAGIDNGTNPADINIHSNEQAPNIPSGAAAEGAQPGAGEAAPQAGGLPGPGDLPGGNGLVQPQRGAVTPANSLRGIPGAIGVPGYPGKVAFGAFEPARRAAVDYAMAAGIPYDPPMDYAKVDQARATRIAAAYEAMPHAPSDPAVKASYDAMIRETIAQWEAIKKTGLRVSPITSDMENPYKATPRQAILDVIHNNHLWFFPTDNGFGGSESAAVDIAGNPLLAFTGETIGGMQMRANDIFRIVHDYFGHIKEGVGFRADGEENAWRAHSAMYSEAARPAMTSETRGQNSWVNFGPYAEFNKTANGDETQYAPQKTGIMPAWTWREAAR